MRVLVTGGCGFIGSAVVRNLVLSKHEVLNIDKLTYAGDLRTVECIKRHSNYRFGQRDILDESEMVAAVASFGPDAIFNLAAESHVDRSIDNPGAFIDTNVRGTYVMLQVALGYWRQLDSGRQSQFRFIQVSTDEVYGSLGTEGYFTETTAYAPRSPYSASKAAADHLVSAWHTTYQLPTIISNCSNNYGPFQNREKLLPTIIRKALLGQPIPIYGKGNNVRDWLYVEDHVAALLAVHANGKVGSRYNIGGQSEVSNIEFVRMICAILDQRRPRSDGKAHAERIQFVEDRPGHDFRYAIEPAKAKAELGWAPREKLETGLSKTVDWYLEHPDWTTDAIGSDERLGLSVPPARI